MGKQASKPSETLPLNHSSFINSKFIGQGAFGMVHKVNHVDQPSKDLAIKTMLARDQEDQIKFQKEIETLHSLEEFSTKPRSLPKFHGFYRDGFSNSSYNLVFDYYSLNLAQIIEFHQTKSTPIHFEFIFKVFEDVVATMAFLQTKEICHRDLKPSNFLWDNHQKRIIISDFGESKQTVASFSGNSKNDLTIAGTPKYFSPELNADYLLSNERSLLNPFKNDVFALGLIVLEMGNLKLPSKHADKNQWENAIQSDLKMFRRSYRQKLTNEKDLSRLRFLFKLLKDCLQFDPAERPDFKLLFQELLIKEMNRDNEFFRELIVWKEKLDQKKDFLFSHENEQNEFQIQGKAKFLKPEKKPCENIW